MKTAGALLMAIIVLALFPGWLPAAADQNSGSSKLSFFFEAPPLKFGFDGSGENIAKIYCDNEHLKLSAYNDEKYLYVQAAIYDDGVSEGTGEISQDRRVVDYSEVLFAMGPGERRTPDIDKNYFLNPLAGMEGLYCQTVLSDDSFSGLEKAAGGDGKIVYLPAGDNKKVRFDRYAIALRDISGFRSGRAIKFCFYAYSEKPRFEINSAGFNLYGKDFINAGPNPYYSHSIPLKMYHDYTFTYKPSSKSE